MEKSHTFKVNNGGLQDGSIVLVKKIPPNTPISPTPGVILMTANKEYSGICIIDTKPFKFTINVVDIDDYLKDMKFIYTKNLIKGAEIKELIEFLSTNDNVNQLNRFLHISTAHNKSRSRSRPKSRSMSRPKSRPSRYPNRRDNTVDFPQIIQGVYSAKSIRRRRKSRRHKKTNRRHKKSNNRHKKSNRRR